MEDKDNKYTHVNISDILSRFRCKKCNINYPDKIEYIGISSFTVAISGYICDSCRKIDNRDFIINEILS